MNLWNVAGELDSPKNMTVGLNNPFYVMKVAFHWSSSLIKILLYLDQILNFVKMVASLTILMRLEIRGSGYASLVVSSLKY